MIKDFKRVISDLKTDKHIENSFSGEDWDAIDIELELPEDYRLFINELGTGVLSEFIWILNPFTRVERFNLIDFTKWKKDSYKILKDDFNFDFSYQIYPEKNGLLPFAFTDNGDTVYWKISSVGNDEWSIIIVDAEDDEIESFEYSFSEFITRILEDKLDSEIITEENIQSKTFQPYKITQEDLK